MFDLMMHSTHFINGYMGPGGIDPMTHCTTSGCFTTKPCLTPLTRNMQYCRNVNHDAVFKVNDKQAVTGIRLQYMM